MEDLGVAYIMAVCARAGCAAEPVRRDYGIDLKVQYYEALGERVVPAGCFEVQLKSTTQWQLVQEGLRYELDIDTYEFLTLPRGQVPRILVVFAMPPDEKSWVQQDDDVLALRRCAWWADLAGASQSKNRRSITLTLPAQQRFSVGALRGVLMQKTRLQGVAS